MGLGGRASRRCVYMIGGRRSRTPPRKGRWGGRGGGGKSIENQWKYNRKLHTYAAVAAELCPANSQTHTRAHKRTRTCTWHKAYNGACMHMGHLRTRPRAARAHTGAYTRACASVCLRARARAHMHASMHPPARPSSPVRPARPHARTPPCRFIRLPSRPYRRRRSPRLSRARATSPTCHRAAGRACFSRSGRPPPHEDSTRTSCSVGATGGGRKEGC